MVAKPKCKLCGKAHWSYEGHDIGPVTPSVTPVTPTVTQRRNKGLRVTPSVTQEIRQAMPLADSHACPLCGLWHHRKYPTNAARQRAYRERKRDHS